MAIKELKKTVTMTSNKAVESFISRGGTLSEQISEDKCHRLTLRIPKDLMNKIDEKRKGRVGKISRNLWILQIIERATRS